MSAKLLSARHHSHWDKLRETDRWHADHSENPALDIVFYTPSVVNSPRRIEVDINRSRDKLKDLVRRPLRLEAAEKLESIRHRDKEHSERAAYTNDWFAGPIPKLQPTYGQVAQEYAGRERQIGDPTTLILIDEADRLRMASLEQVRAIFDAQEIGLILIRHARARKTPRAFYSRIGFVHEFRSLGAPEVRRLLEQHWAPPGVKLPGKPLDPEAVAVIIRVTGGNFRLLNRLLTQIQRILEINTLEEVPKAVVEAARESLVIGQV